VGREPTPARADVQESEAIATRSTMQMKAQMKAEKFVKASGRAPAEQERIRKDYVGSGS